MSIHDLKALKRTSILPPGKFDTLSTESRRSNQNPETISMNNEGITEASATVPNAQSVVIDLSFTNTQNEGPIAAFWEVALYVGSVAPENQLYPWSAYTTLTSTFYEIIPLTGALYDDDTQDTSAVTKHTERGVVWNRSGNTQTFILRARSRYIFNRG